jgi:Ca2+-binding RTX toxin-like protein
VTVSLVTGDLTSTSTGNITVTATTGSNVITTGTGADTITGGTGIDALTSGDGDDTIVYAGTAELLLVNDVIDLVDGGVGTADAIRFDGATTIGAGNLLARITNVEQIKAAATAGVISITATATQAGSVFFGTQFNTIDLSGDTNINGSNVISITGVTGITTITGSAGIDTITIGAAAVANTITGGLGVDVLLLGATLASTVVVGTLDTGDTYATADKITGFTTVVDKLKLGVAGVTANFATANGAADFAAAVTAANTAMDSTVKYYLATAIVADLGGGAGLESLLFIDADMNGTLDDVIVLVGIAGVVVAGDIIA